MSSLRRGHANLLCIVPILTDDPRRESNCRGSGILRNIACRRRPYRVECTGSLSTSEVKQRRARLVLGWGTAWEDPWVLSAFRFLFDTLAKCEFSWFLPWKTLGNVAKRSKTRENRRKTFENHGTMWETAKSPGKRWGSWNTLGNHGTMWETAKSPEKRWGSWNTMGNHGTMWETPKSPEKRWGSWNTLGNYVWSFGFKPEVRAFSVGFRVFGFCLNPNPAVSY